jgi:1,4-dihydroxy-2-naphthoyl-CoA synthase
MSEQLIRYSAAIDGAARSLVATTEDCQEGLNAFVEKRSPNCKGR